MGKSKDLATGVRSGDFTVDTDTLHVDATNNKVGVGTTSPNRLFSVSSSTTRTSGFEDIAEYVTPSIGVGGSTSLNVGKANSNYDLAKMAFKYNGAGSTSNELGFGFYGADNLLKIDGSGYVTMPNQPKFKVRRNSSSVTLTGNNAKQNLVFNVEDFDIGGGYNTTTGKYTVPATGVYFFFLNPRFDGITSSTYARALIYKGASIPGSPWSDYGNVLSSIDGDNHSTNYHTLNVSGIFSCVAGDVINFLGGGHSDSSITLQAESQAGGFMIG